MIRQAIEPLESRIAPAVTIINPLFDIQAGAASTGTILDLGKMMDPTMSNRTLVEFSTNVILPGQTVPGKIVIELFDDKAPLSVQNFLRYVANGTYDTTFFHRIFDFQSDDQTDIIQGGGYPINSIFTQVPKFTTVHNEFDATDPEVQNIRGTLAMAKTSVSPHTASSEWFFNLTDNSSILGAENNGGFTVFGKIVSGIEVADAIGKANKTNIGGALTDLPVQNGYTSGIPSQSQFMRITDARIVEAEGNANGHTFSVVSSDPALVKTKLNANTNELTLTYGKGKAGSATITVTVSKGGETTTDTFDVHLTPNMISTVETNTIPDVIVPGDKGFVKVKIANNAGGSVNGAVKLRLYLSSTANGTAAALELDENDIEITPAAGAMFNLALQSGKTTVLSVPYLIPDTLSVTDEYILLVKPEATDAASQDLFTDDNVGFSGLEHEFTRGFGSLGSRSKVPLTVTDVNGDTVTFTLTGPGAGAVTKSESGVIDVTVTNSTPATTLTAKTAKGVIVDIDDLFIQDTIGSVKLGNVHLHGNFTASEGAKSIILGDLGSATGGVDKSLSIGQHPIATQKLSVSFGSVNDYTFFSATPVSTFTASSWLNDEVATAANEINVAGISTLKIAGDLEAKLLISSPAKTTLLSVGGALRGGGVISIGDVNSMKFGSIENSSILIGLSERPDALSDFSAGKKVGSLTVAGNVTGATIAATSFNSIVIGSADGAGEAGGGIFADAIKSYLRKGPLPAKKLTNLADPSGTEPRVEDAIGDGYAVRIF